MRRGDAEKRPLSNQPSRHGEGRAAATEVIAKVPGFVTKAGKRARSISRSAPGFLFGKQSGTEVRVDGEDFLVMKESAVMRTLEATAATRKAA
jgi:chaperonin GroES